MTSSLRWIVVRSLHSFFSKICCLWYCRSFHPSYSSSKLVRSLDWFSSLTSLSGNLNQSLHSLLFPVVYPKVPYLAHSLSLLAQWSQKIPSNIICTLMTPSCTSLSLLQILLYLLKHHLFQWHSLLDELEQTASQSIKNWISSHWHKTTASQIFWSNKLISQQLYHPSQFLCSQSWLHLWLWHVFLWSNQLCIQIL